MECLVFATSNLRKFCHQSHPSQSWCSRRSWQKWNQERCLQSGMVSNEPRHGYSNHQNRKLFVRWTLDLLSPTSSPVHSRSYQDELTWHQPPNRSLACCQKLNCGKFELVEHHQKQWRKLDRWDCFGCLWRMIFHQASFAFLQPCCPLTHCTWRQQKLVPEFHSASLN